AGAGAGAGAAGSPPQWPARLRRTEVAWALLPVIGILVVWVYFLVDPGSLAFRLGARGLSRIGAGKVDLTIAVVIALGAAAAVIGASRLRPALRVGAIGGVIAVDLLVYGAQQYTFDSTPTAQLQGRTLAEKALAAAAGPGRRIAFDDPGTLPSLHALEMLGLPDDNILEGVSSANGYGSLVNATYDKLTGAHANVTLALGAIGNGTLDQLDVGILATPGPTQAPPDKALSAQLAKGGWVAAGTLDGYSLWRPTRSLGPLWTVPPSTGSKLGNLHRGQQDAWSAAISTTAPTEVVRSVAYAPGWSAVVSGPSIGTRTVPVVRQGLVQGAFVPARVTHIAWRYNPPGLTKGIALTALGALAMASLAIADPTMGVLSKRRRRKHTG
ncbi:MAG: hypothetical protein ACRDZQ_12695, partial [Acidimicrobiales bacterium]